MDDSDKKGRLANRVGKNAPKIQKYFKKILYLESRGEISQCFSMSYYIIILLCEC